MSSNPLDTSGFRHSIVDSIGGTFGSVKVVTTYQPNNLAIISPVSGPLRALKGWNLAWYDFLERIESAKRRNEKAIMEELSHVVHQNGR